MSKPPKVSAARLFSEPPLNAAVPQKPLYVAGNNTHSACVLFLMPRENAVQVLDLWRCDVAAQPGKTGLGAQWLRSEDLAALAGAAGSAESEAERAERERLRQFASGITQFQLRPEQRQLLVVVGGQGLLLELDSKQARRLTPAADRHSGFCFSPKGRYLSYVRSGELYVLEIDSGHEQRVTNDASETVFSGLPDFIAQEEMHRFTGHWWHPQETHLAFQRTDESPVPIAWRHDIKADSIEVIAQRYPYAGGPNAAVQLGVYTIADARTHWLDYSDDPEDYLARVDWIDDHLLVQRQSRDQQKLALLRFANGAGQPTILHTESANTWINLHDNLLAVGEQELCWTSEDQGLARLLVAPRNTANAALDFTELTDTTMHVSQVHGYRGQRLWFSGWQHSPTELHLFYCAKTPQGWQPPQQVSATPGWHQCQVAVDADDTAVIVDLHSALDQPPTLTLTNDSDASSVIAGGPIAAGHPYHEFMAAHQTPTLGTLTAEDGTLLHYRLTKPEQASAASPAPAIVYVYGGPGGARIHNEWAPLLLQMLSGAGYAVFELDNRGTGNRGRQFDAPIYQAMGGAEVRDQLLGAAWLGAQDWIDAKRIGVFGHSYGGFMTLKCLLAAPDVFAAGVSVAPVTDWKLYDTHYTERYLGHPQSHPEVYAASGLLGQCGSLASPLLLIHGMADDNVLFANTTALIAELQQQAIKFELMTYPGSKHALQEPWVSTHRFNLLLDFFARTLAV
ncbi:MAG: alpha/beta fold hydrolase [Pseudomonadales bacterium]